MNGPKSRQRNHKIAETFKAKQRHHYTRDGWEGGEWGGLSTSIAKQPLVERGVVAPMGGKWV